MQQLPGPNNSGQEEKNILQRTVNLIMYDCWVLIYIFLLCFFIYWTVKGHAYLEQEEDGSSCRTYKGGIIIQAEIFNLVAMWLYIGFGVIAFLFTLLVNACDEGSCTCLELCRCLILCCTCGCCDPGNLFGRENGQRAQGNGLYEARENRRGYSE